MMELLDDEPFDFIMNSDEHASGKNGGFCSQDFQFLDLIYFLKA